MAALLDLLQELCDVVGHGDGRRETPLTKEQGGKGRLGASLELLGGSRGAGVGRGRGRPRERDGGDGGAVLRFPDGTEMEPSESSWPATWGEVLAFFRLVLLAVWLLNRYFQGSVRCPTSVRVLCLRAGLLRAPLGRVMVGPAYLSSAPEPASKHHTGSVGPVLYRKVAVS